MGVGWRQGWKRPPSKGPSSSLPWAHPGLVVLQLICQTLIKALLPLCVLFALCFWEARTRGGRRPSHEADDWSLESVPRRYMTRYNDALFWSSGPTLHFWKKKKELPFCC